MLERLYVKNLALIKEQEVLFTKGLNILSGETGAGKSVILGSILLALGERADRDLIRQGEEYALIELTFRAENEKEKQALRALDLLPEEDGTVLIKRKIYPNRTVNTACGESVTLAELKRAGEALLSVYGQHESMRLLHREEQRKILDAYAGKEGEALLTEVRKLHGQLKDLEKALQETALDENARRREEDLLRYEIAELNGAGLIVGEDEALETSYKTLNNAEKIREALLYAERALQEEGVGERLSTALREIAKVAKYSDALQEIEKQMTDIDALIAETDRSIDACLREMSADPEELQRVTERLNEINRLKDKYQKEKGTNVGTGIEDLLQALSEREERLGFLEDLEKAKEVRTKEYEEKKAGFLNACERLSALRKESGRALSAEMENALKDLRFSPFFE